jgi:hypothetical protein
LEGTTLIELDRGDFLRLGAGGVVAAAAAGLVSAPADAALPAPTPQGDDEAFLGPDAPLTSHFATVLPKRAVATKARILALGQQLELLLVRVYLNGVGYAQDPSTRLFLGRLLTYDAQQLAWLRGHDGEASPAGLLSPIDLEPAADQLDQFLSTPDFPD